MSDNAYRPQSRMPVLPACRPQSWLTESFQNSAVPAAALLLLLGSATTPSPPATRASDAPGHATSVASSKDEIAKRRVEAESRSADRQARPAEVKTEPNKTEKKSQDQDESASEPKSQQRTSDRQSSNSNSSAQAEGGTSSGSQRYGSGPDVKGIQPSVYTGRYYRPEYETFRRCVVHRESRGDYTVRNSSSGASGAYQFMLGTSNEVARMMDRPDLIGRPAGTWTRAEQDEAFYTLYNHGRGASHWGGSCR